MERFGYDPYDATAEKTLSTVYYLLRERVRSDFGMFRERVPEKPSYCRFRDSKQYHEYVQAWQDQLCGLKRWTRDEQLDDYLMNGEAA